MNVSNTAKSESETITKTTESPRPPIHNRTCPRTRVIKALNDDGTIRVVNCTPRAVGLGLVVPSPFSPSRPHRWRPMPRQDAGIPKGHPKQRVDQPQRQGGPHQRHERMSSGEDGGHQRPCADGKYQGVGDAQKHGPVRPDYQIDLPPVHRARPNRTSAGTGGRPV